MLKQNEKRLVLTPFVVAYAEEESRRRSEPARKKQPGAHLSKDEATKEVLNRIVDRVKRI